MVTALIIGATRGLGASLANLYAKGSSNTVFGTTRSSRAPTSESLSKKINWVTDIDLLDSGVGTRLVNQLGLLGVGNGMVKDSIRAFDIVIIAAGYFATEDFSAGLKWDEEVKMYSMSLLFLVFHPSNRTSVPPSLN
jgi:short-subunit dehydrogenase